MITDEQAAKLAVINELDYKFFDLLWKYKNYLPQHVQDELEWSETRRLDVYEITEEYLPNKNKQHD